MNSSVRICLVIPGHWSQIMGGAQYQAQRIVEALIADGRFEVHYLARSIGEDVADTTGYQLHRLHTLFGSRKGYLFLDAPSLLKTLKRIGPDVIYQRTGSSYTGVSAWYARRHGCRMVWHTASESDVSGPSFNGSGRRKAWQWVDGLLLNYGIRRVETIVTQTEDQKRQLARGYHREATRVIPNFHPLPTAPVSKSDRIRVVWVANLKRIKRPEIFVDLAADLAARTDAVFTMAGGLQGSAEWRARLMERIEATPNLQYRGAMSQDEVNELLAESHLLVNTSSSEGFSNTFVQAWMRKTPVVSLNVNPDGVFDDQRLGLYAGTYPRLLDLTLELIEDGPRRRAMGEEASVYAVGRHSESNASRLIELLLP